MTYYLILIGTLLITLAAFFLVKKFASKKATFVVVERVFVFLLMAIFVTRFISYVDVQSVRENYTTYSFYGGLLSTFENVIGELCIWFELTAALFLFLRPFFKFKTATFYTKWISTPVLIVSSIFLKSELHLMMGSDIKPFTAILYAVELGSLLSLAIYYFNKDFNLHISKHSYFEVGIISALGNFFTMPPFIPMYFFGLGNINYHIIDLNIPHRLFIYFLVLALPLFIYFSFRNCTPDKIQYTLIFISLGTLLNFLSLNKYDVWLEPWNWPWHLCNTAMFLMPICYIFKPKRLFYFTYFINVFGALLAMLMPNYNEALTIWDPVVIQFWFNHMIAFWMPLLGVALKLYDRPKMKQYFYSSIYFAIYFIIVLFLNAFFGAIGQETDFFFINSNFIAEKLGDWAQNLFRGTFDITIGSLTMTFHPVYQIIYFISYFLLGFGVWFVYQLGFDISDSHIDLRRRLKGIRQDHFALMSSLEGRSFDEPMDEYAGVKMQLKHFSKRYGHNKHYSVHDANLEVFGGEIFGFLGPNGAGKSTIIKSTVGIQPIEEGQIEICGFDVHKQPVQAKSLIGFVPDHYALYEKLTGREYLNYIADIYEVSQADRDERLSKYIHLFELESSIDNKIKTYSHGMKQKITIMAALVHNPKVWILDEPLTGLDPTSIYQVKECMKQHAKEGNIVFFSSHIIDIVEKLCNRIAIIKKGQIQTIKTIEEIENSGTTLEEFYLNAIGDTTTEVDKHE